MFFVLFNQGGGGVYDLLWLTLDLYINYKWYNSFDITSINICRMDNIFAYVMFDNIRKWDW
jgi:hypothetical protein